MSDRPPKNAFDKTLDSVIATGGWLWDFLGEAPPEPPKSDPQKELPTDPAPASVPENVLDVDGHEVE